MVSWSNLSSKPVHSELRARERSKTGKRKRVEAELPTGNVRGDSHGAGRDAAAPYWASGRNQSGRWAVNAALEQLASLLVRARIKPETLPCRCDIRGGGRDVVEPKVE